nr:MAG TPA: hypothetical protein [Caudoviricetes sp.]
MTRESEGHKSLFGKSFPLMFLISLLKYNPFVS